MPSREIIQDLIRRNFAALSALDAEAWTATFAPDAEMHDPVGQPPHHGHAGIRAFANGLCGTFQSLSMTADQVFIGGSEAAVKWTARGVAKNGKSVTLEGIDTFLVNDEGQIVSGRGYWHPEEMGAQLQG